MKLRLSLLICAVTFLWPQPSLLATSTVQLVGMEGRVPPATAELPAIFGNQQAGIDIEINGFTAASGPLRADFLQVAGGLAMPLAKDVLLQHGIFFFGTSLQHLHVSMKFPDVKQRAEVLVRFSLSNDLPSGKQIELLGDLRFVVFPASVTRELADLLQPKPDARVIIFGPGQKLRHFLTGLHVPFEDNGSDTPNRFDSSRLYFGELATEQQFQQAQDRSAGGRVALFSPDQSLPTGVYSDRSSAGVLIHVTSPLLDNLSDDPRSQLGLIKIIHLLSAPPPSAN